MDFKKYEIILAERDNYCDNIKVYKKTNLFTYKIRENQQ